jgi:hypothetical protein
LVWWPIREFVMNRSSVMITVFLEIDMWMISLA